MMSKYNRSKENNKKDNIKKVKNQLQNLSINTNN